MIDKKLETLAYRLRDLSTLRNLFSELNFDFADKPVNKDNWNDEQKKIVQEAKIIASKDDYQIYYIQTNTDSLKEWKGISSKIIKENNGLCMICSHNPSGFKWIFSSLSKEFSKSFSETRHVPIDINPDLGVPHTFVEFLEKIRVEKDATSTSIVSQISDAFDSFAVQIHDELTVNVFEALKTLSEGIIGNKNNNLSLTDETLENIREPIFTLLYRIIFVLYAEDRGIFPIDNKIYQEEFSLKWIKQEWLLESTNTKKLAEFEVEKRLKKLFRLIEIGSDDLNYNPDEFFMSSYYGRLFDRTENNQLEKWKISNKHLLDAINLVTKTSDKNGSYFLDYSALNTRHLGHVYEHLLEFHLEVVDGKIKDLPDPTERKLTASYYTPQYIVDYIIENTLEPEISRIQKESDSAQVIEKLLSLKILDPAMGSGHFLVTATNYLARRICEIEENENKKNYNERQRDVVRKCIYGVDLNALAVDLAKVALWLETLSSDKPLSFLSSHLKHGNSLLGESIEGIYDKQTTMFEKTSRSKLKKTVRDYVGFELLEDDTKSAVKAKIEKFNKINSKGSFYHQLRGILDHKLAEEFGIKLKPWKDLRQKIGVEGLDFHFPSESGDSVSEVRSREKFFHWDLEFLEVFYDEDGKKKKNGGFDIVIGNPPYITTRKIPEEQREVYWKKYENFLKDEMNTYTLFYAKIDELLRRDGFWGFISPSGWYTNNPYDKLRKWFFRNNSIKKIVDFPYRFFPFKDVNTETAIVVGTKMTENKNIIEILRGEKETLKKTKKITNELLENKIIQSSVFDIPKNKFYIYQTEISEKLSKIKRKFGEIIEVHNPSSLDRKKRYPKTKKQYSKCVFTQEELNDDQQLKKICKPCLVGEDIQRYFCLKTKRFTNIKWKEKGIEKQLSSGTQNWMNQLKIVGQRITGQVSRRMIFSVDLENRITMPSANIVLLKDYALRNDEERKRILYYLQALLNSKLINYFYETQYGEANTNITSDVLEEMPLVLEIEPIWEKSEKLSKFYDQKNKQNEEKIGKLESEIDSEIYQIYGLTKSEIDIIEEYYKK
tara:strand:+ start:758 stop:3931 length:3174 start_codon:yes stop_codon:yes gene_type:complete